MNAYELKQVSAMIKSLENTFMERLRQMERSYLDALKGFGIIDDEKMWTEKQVCEKYGIDRKTMYNYRKINVRHEPDPPMRQLPPLPKATPDKPKRRFKFF